MGSRQRKESRVTDEFRAFFEVWRFPKAKTLTTLTTKTGMTCIQAIVQLLRDPLKAAEVNTQCIRCGSGGWPERPRLMQVVEEMEKSGAKLGDKSSQWESKS